MGQLITRFLHVFQAVGVGVLILAFFGLWTWCGHNASPEVQTTGMNLLDGLEQATCIATPIPALLKTIHSAPPVWEEGFEEEALEIQGGCSDRPGIRAARNTTLVYSGNASLEIHRAAGKIGDTVIAMDIAVPEPGLHRFEARATLVVDRDEFAAALAHNPKASSYQIKLNTIPAPEITGMVALDPAGSPLLLSRCNAVTENLFHRILTTTTLLYQTHIWWPLSTTVLVPEGCRGLRITIEARQFAGSLHLDALCLRRTFPMEQLLHANTYRYAGGAPGLHHLRKMVRRENEDRLCLFAPAPTTLEYRVHLPENAGLDLGMAVMDLPRGMDSAGPTVLAVEVIPEGGHPVKVAEYQAVPGSKAADRWEDRTIDLSAFQEQTALVRLTSRGTPGKSPTCFPGAGAFSTPRIFTRGTGKKRRSLLIITSDELHTGHLGFLGYERQTTPTLTAMARSGALFPSTIVQAPVTYHSMPSMHTSSYLRRGFTGDFGYHFNPETRSIADVLRGHGYKTAAFMSEYYFNNLFKGFDRRARVPTTLSNVEIDRRHLEGAITFLEKNRDEPFFLWIHFLGTHTPWKPTGKYATFLEKIGLNGKKLEAISREVKRQGLGPDAAFKRLHAGLMAAYDGEILRMDDHVKRLLRALDRLGLAGRTVVAFTSDHGADMIPENYLNRSLRDDTVKVPLLLRLPGVVPASFRHDGIVELIDLAPTLLDLLGLPGPRTFDGKSLMPLLTGCEHHKQAAFTRLVGTVGIRTGRWKLITRDEDLWKDGTDNITLFDLEGKEGEEMNVASGHPEIVAALKKRLRKWTKTDEDNLEQGEIGGEVRRYLEDAGYLKRTFARRKP